MGGLGALAYVAAADPAKGGWFLPCPFHEVTGLWCPGCGLTRATHQLLRGHVLSALGSNLMLPVFGALVLVAWADWVVPRRVRGPWLARVPATMWWALGAAMVTFAVLRNLPVGRPLAP
jgi:Protein of unknown function (DUF2752)